ncbi:hypothetical protein GALL_40450 [mine drainage metagenome]|uniref:Uncharacterized protein n=1 Tax=mine drainage metagenome TaxID=410659 RepID=A0A1J5T236_9ZZZZ
MAVASFNAQAPRDSTGLIEVRVREVAQLFNSMDPSPFHERDLDADAEEFIISWAHEHPRAPQLKLVVHLTRPPVEGNAEQRVREAVHHYFAYRARLNWLEFKQLMRQGRTALVVGFSFLAVCFGLGQVIAGQGSGTWRDLLREGLTIIGWVAMWRPLQIYLYDWWPLRRRGLVFRKLSVMDVEVRTEAGADTTNATPNV